jgi:glycosyltransferase involved in cell wall biosynthesis
MKNFKKPEISVIICTRNPRMDYLDRVLEALRLQMLPLERWELLLIDNKSEEPLGGRLDLSWHPAGRIIREDEVGLTHARLRAMRESVADLLLFLDDDNVVFEDYLEQGLKISSQWPILGVWGGRWIAEYEKGMPSDWTFDPWSTHFEKDNWSNNYDREVAPYGGGMYVRKKIANAYKNNATKNPIKKLLGRRGSSLASYEDYDISFTACDMGLGMGRFVDLKITHLIPASRTTPEYCRKIREDSVFSEILFRFSRGEKIVQPSRAEAILESYKFFRMVLSGKDTALARAERRGRRRAYEFLRQFRNSQ